MRISPQLFLPGVGCPGNGVPGSLKEPAETPVAGAARAQPRIRALRRPSLTFQREPAARVVLPRARPHHPGHSSGQRGHPGGSFVWKLYPGKGEIGRRARRWEPSGTPPERGEPLPKEAGETEGGPWGGGLLASSPGRERLEKEPGWEARVQDFEPRVGKFTGNLGEWPRAWDAGEGSQSAATSQGRGWGREHGRPESLPVVTPSAGILALEHLLVLSPKAWSRALSCDWPTGRPSRVAETRADWATAATFSSHPRWCRDLGRPQRDPRCAPAPGEKDRLLETGRESLRGGDSC